MTETTPTDPTPRADAAARPDALDWLMDQVDRLGWGMSLHQTTSDEWIAHACLKQDRDVYAASGYLSDGKLAATRVQAVQRLIANIQRREK